MAKTNEQSSQGRALSTHRTRLEQAIEQAHEEYRDELFRRRLEVARQGVRDFQSHRIGEAAKAFHSYLQILENWKGVPEGGLHPKLFDSKKDAAEMLLVAGVYWDLVKLYDRTKSKNKKNEFHQFLQKFVLFSKGTSFQPLASETLRKYIASGKTLHREDFKNAYRTITGSNCFVATSLMDVCDERTLPRLRVFRDESLLQHRLGKRFVHWYYRRGPGLARVMDKAPGPVRRICGRLIDWLAASVSP